MTGRILALAGLLALGACASGAPREKEYYTRLDGSPVTTRQCKNEEDFSRPASPTTGLRLIRTTCWEQPIEKPEPLPLLGRLLVGGGGAGRSTAGFWGGHGMAAPSWGLGR